MMREIMMVFVPPRGKQESSHARVDLLAARVVKGSLRNVSITYQGGNLLK
jgi:hypothetical protein